MEYQKILSKRERKELNYKIWKLSTVFNRKELSRVIKNIEKNNCQDFENIVFCNDYNQFSKFIIHSKYETYNYLNGKYDSVCTSHESTPTLIFAKKGVAQKIKFGVQFENEEDGVTDKIEPKFRTDKTYLIMVQEVSECSAIVNPEQNNYFEKRKFLVLYKKGRIKC